MNKKEASARIKINKRKEKEILDLYREIDLKQRNIIAQAETVWNHK